MRIRKRKQLASPGSNNPQPHALGHGHEIRQITLLNGIKAPHQVSRATLKDGLRIWRRADQLLAPQTVARNTRPFEVEKGWVPDKQDPRMLIGQYRTRGARAFEGAIDTRDKLPRFFVIDLVGYLVNGPHAACFHEDQRGHGWFWIHLAPEPRHIPSGIIAVEDLIRKTLAVNGGR